MSKVTTAYNDGFDNVKYYAGTFLDREQLKKMLQPIEIYNHGALVIAYKQGYLKGFFGDMYKPTYTLTQLEVAHALQSHDCWFVASACLREWAKGETYYIDTRTGVSKRILSLMKKANKEVGKT